MMATITIQPAELEAMVRAHVQKITGLDKITQINFRCVEEHEAPVFEGAEVIVSLKEVNH